MPTTPDKNIAGKCIGAYTSVSMLEQHGAMKKGDDLRAIITVSPSGEIMACPFLENGTCFKIPERWGDGSKPCVYPIPKP
jgi:hypothetical protein